ncbi:hypothetical protein H920_00487 [Fukomys damarensis]|uniref:Uncharacterized protein n=1 Tax=Fukomys damarensis TaxID=885580 RepID=A0A091E422_FUKDA|nr:hypothetical protein H920_00487 [Fukomys damarensis]
MAMAAWDQTHGGRRGQEGLDPGHWEEEPAGTGRHCGSRGGPDPGVAAQCRQGVWLHGLERGRCKLVLQGAGEGESYRGLEVEPRAVAQASVPLACGHQVFSVLQPLGPVSSASGDAREKLGAAPIGTSDNDAMGTTSLHAERQISTGPEWDQGRHGREELEGPGSPLGP